MTAIMMTTSDHDDYDDDDDDDDGSYVIWFLRGRLHHRLRSAMSCADRRRLRSAARICTSGTSKNTTTAMICTAGRWASRTWFALSADHAATIWYH
jgi:hypothetical protein